MKYSEKAKKLEYEETLELKNFILLFTNVTFETSSIVVIPSFRNFNSIVFLYLNSMITLHFAKLLLANFLLSADLKFNKGEKISRKKLTLLWIRLIVQKLLLTL